MFGKINFVEISLLLILISSSCVDSNSKNTFEEKNNNGINENTGSSKVVAELPVKIDSSKFIAFPIIELNEQKNNRNSYTINKRYASSYKNLIFRNTENQKTHFLSSKDIDILNFNQLRNLNNDPEKVILYRVIDKQHLGKKLKKVSLYLSNNEGKNFTKISMENHHLKNWKYIPSLRKVYFSTAVDIDKNEKLNEKDKYFIYAVSIDDFKVDQLLNDEL